MNNLKISKHRTPDLAHISHLPPISIHGRRPEFKAQRHSIDSLIDSHFNPLTNTQFSVRHPIEHRGSQLDSQHSYSQAVLTQSQNSQQFSQKSGEGFGIASNNAWHYGSRASDLTNKRPRSPSHPVRTSQFPQYNSKDGSNSVLASQQSTAQSLLEQISNRPGAMGKYMLKGDMEQRLAAIENCLNGIFGRVDELQKNLISVEATVKEATRETDNSRRKSALECQNLQALVRSIEESKRGEAMHDEIEMLKLEEISEEVKKIPVKLEEIMSEEVKKIGTSVVEHTTEVKDQILQSLKMELQAILNWRTEGVQDYPEQNVGVKTRSATANATNRVQLTSSRIKMSHKEADGRPRGLPNGLGATRLEIQGDEMYNSSRVTATTEMANITHGLSNQRGSEGYGPTLDSTHTDIPQEEGWRSTRFSKTRASMTEQLPRLSWIASGNDNCTIKDVNIRPKANSYEEHIPGQYTFDAREPITEDVTVEDEDRCIFPSQTRHYIRRRVEPSHQKAMMDDVDRRHQATRREMQKANQPSNECGWSRFGNLKSSVTY